MAFWFSLLKEGNHQFEKDKSRKQNKDGFSAWELDVEVSVAAFVAGDPGHQYWHESEEERAADSAGVAEGGEEDVGIDENDDEGRDVDQAAEEEFSKGCFFHF